MLRQFLQNRLVPGDCRNILEFDHRDLHAGNILVEQGLANEKIRYLYQEEQIDVVSNGVRMSIIDFSITHDKKMVTRLRSCFANDYI
ncbi:hypothetical protein niasHT_006044 [Heterodera trifolii]|uniref:Protein kinase domain-containing protein n=1 Tax=Heterodera trifolii TaxID=157864 RepID=A0ABD2MCT6_9BILA